MLRADFDFVGRSELREQLACWRRRSRPGWSPPRPGGLMRLLLEPPGAAGLDDLVAAGEAVRAAGLDGVLLATSPELPALLVAAAALAARVPSIRIAAEVEVGEAHPVEVAEEAAVVDVASGGRLILVAAPAPGARSAPSEPRPDPHGPGTAPFRFEGPTWRVPAELPQNVHNVEERARVTPSPVQPRLEVWGSGAAREAALARGLGVLAGAGDDPAALGAAWEAAAAALGPAAIGAARARREPYDGDPAALVARLRAGRAAFGQSWAVVAAPPAAALEISRRARRACRPIASRTASRPTGTRPCRGRAPRPVRFGVLLPAFGVRWEEAREVAERAEAAGYDDVWLPDHLLGIPDPDVPVLEAWTALPRWRPPPGASASGRWCCRRPSGRRGCWPRPPRRSPRWRPGA